ncbi:hypothetical protein BVG16_28865 [Paenibacillus selenitireducens]|uniref:Uncharacterized protein n=1 Tax=Paenibacillus selenitireducens TaxID=1324314 RepID=A0A1T2X0Z3_9BACL|nr:hypothetical protein [Paenibacillus selenitireducens]OPA73475.1 hypothetical protein BVG16_28865 [Paenibacillus selenitireducens]
MTQPEKQVNKIAEFSDVFLTLDEVTQEYALALLQTLRFAQSKCRYATGEEVNRPYCLNDVVAHITGRHKRL